MTNAVVSAAMVFYMTREDLWLGVGGSAHKINTIQNRSGKAKNHRGVSLKQASCHVYEKLSTSKVRSGVILRSKYKTTQLFLLYKPKKVH